MGDDAVLHLPGCGHAYHWDCIRPWLEKSRHCPLCHADIRDALGQ
jgi:hypothetical protein